MQRKRRIKKKQKKNAEMFDAKCDSGFIYQRLSDFLLLESFKKKLLDLNIFLYLSNKL